MGSYMTHGKIFQLGNLPKLVVEFSLQWRHNGHDGVWNHQPHDCILNSLFSRRWKKTSKLRVTGLCAGNSPVAGEFPAQMANNAENVSIWWRNHVLPRRCMKSPIPTTLETDILYWLWLWLLGSVKINYHTYFTHSFICPDNSPQTLGICTISFFLAQWSELKNYFCNMHDSLFL